MVAGSWLDNDGKFRQYGTSKAVPETGGDFLAYGDVRQIEVTIDLTTLTTSPLAQSFTTFFPASNTQLFVEKVVVETEVTPVGGTSVSVGTGFMTPGTLTNPPAMTAIDNAAFVSALAIATLGTNGTQVALTKGVTSAGTYIGTTSADQTHKNYITALVAGTFSAGKIKVRIFYRGFGTITQ